MLIYYEKKIAAALGIFLCLTSCSAQFPTVQESDDLEQSTETPVSEKNTASNPPKEYILEKDILGKYTTYTEPEGWVKAEEYSVSDRIFYVQEGQDKDKFPDDISVDNISITIGEIGYNAEEHTSHFKNEMMQQLLVQIALAETDAQLTGDDSQTEQGYILYTFTIEEPDAVTKKYYIVENNRFGLVYVKNLTKSDSVYEAAETIVNSFTWNDVE